ncbi:hypothetical protein PENSPDRAFT_327180 [Peniophora sp. CONT]|nr:hypothetical protein PENSPDRAFT_327180 [Peniophora sp. CONT]
MTTTALAAHGFPARCCKHLMHTVDWPQLPLASSGFQSTIGHRLLECSAGLGQRKTAHVTLVGDVSYQSFDMTPAVPLDPSHDRSLDTILSTCLIERPRHTVFSHTWDRQLLNLSYIFDSGLANGFIVRHRTIPFVDFDQKLVTITHKFVSDKHPPAGVFQSLDPLTVSGRASCLRRKDGTTSCVRANN